MSFADKLIARTEEKRQEAAQQVDELGIPVPRDNKGRALLNYLTARAIVRNPHLYTASVGGRVRLYNAHEEVRTNVESISSLCDWWEPMTPQSRFYIYKRLSELVPKLDRSKIAITPDLLWDIENHELISCKGIKTIA